MKDEIKEMCHKCKKYPAEYNQTYCEFCLGISNKDDYITNLQDRIDKAIEYMKPKFIEQGGLTSYEVNDLLNDLLSILQGSDK